MLSNDLDKLHYYFHLTALRPIPGDTFSTPANMNKLVFTYWAFIMEN
jgi:hypothetical protein